MEYLYILEVKDEDNTFKIGKTKREFKKRLNEYDNIAREIKHAFVQDSDISEKLLMKELKNNKNIIRRRDLGLEYYTCDLSIIISIFDKITNNSYQNNICIPMKFDIVCDECCRSFSTIGGLKTHKRHCKGDIMIID